MSPTSFTTEPLPGASFGAVLRFSDPSADAAVAAVEADSEALLNAFYAAQGFLYLPNLPTISEQPELLLRLSRLFGPEVEDYRATLTPESAIHPEVPEILLVSNMAPVNRQPPPRPDPPLTADGQLPTQFPQRRGWHTDQSFRRPPPDVSLFYAVIASPEGQGQTLYANGIAAYAALPEHLKQRIENLEGWHVLPGMGRSEHAVRAGETPQTLQPHQQPQRQPVVREHPVTGERALYLCEAGQMDWITGPFVDMPAGPDGEGAQLLYELMTHYTQPQFTYTHNWNASDLVIYDNRSMIHAATWFDAERHQRMMWRTTVMGNPGELYKGEAKSWIAKPAA